MQDISFFAIFKAKSGKAGELFTFFKDVSGNMKNYSGCTEYRVFKDLKNAENVCVFESWTNERAHKDSLADPNVKEAITRGMMLIERVESQSVLSAG